MATAVYPYTIGKSVLDFAEEYNTTYDSVVFFGIAEAFAEAERTATDSQTVVGKAIARQFESLDLSTDGEAIGVAVIASRDLPASEDQDTVVGVAEIDFAEENLLVGLTIGNAEVDTVEEVDYALTGFLNISSSIQFRHALKVVRKSRYKVYGDSQAVVVDGPTISGIQAGFPALFGEILDTAVASVTTSGFVIDYSLQATSVGRTRFGSVESSVAIYRLLPDEDTVSGNASMSATVETIDDYWLLITDQLARGFARIGSSETADPVVAENQSATEAIVSTSAAWTVNQAHYGKTTLDLHPASITSYDGIAYQTIPIANRVVSGKAVPYVNAYEAVVGIGIPELVNEPLIKFSSTISSTEVYEPSFLRGVITAHGAMGLGAGASLWLETAFSGSSRGKAALAAPLILNGYDSLGNDHSRYGGGGDPPGTYGTGKYAYARGSEPDIDIGGGHYRRILGGYIIGVSTVEASLDLNDDLDIGGGSYNRTLVGRVSTTSSLTATGLNN